MKLYLFLLFAFLISFTALTASEEITKVAPQKVLHVLNMVDDLSNEDEHVIILKDGSAWITRDTDLPIVGDIVKSPDGWSFVNTTQFGHFHCENIGTIIYNPLKIEKILTVCPIDKNKDFDATFISEVGDIIETSSDEKLFLLSNQLIYEDESWCDDNFSNWECVESLQLIRRDEVDQQQYLACLERNEIRPVNTMVYQTSALVDVNVDNQMFLLDEDDRPWCTFCSHAETLSTWDPGHLIRVVTRPSLAELREEEELEIDNEELVLLRLFFYLQHGCEMDPSIFETENCRIGFVMNMDTGEIVFMWDWITQ